MIFYLTSYILFCRRRKCDKVRMVRVVKGRVKVLVRRVTSRQGPAVQLGRSGKEQKSITSHHHDMILILIVMTMMHNIPKYKGVFYLYELKRLLDLISASVSFVQVQQF